MNELALAYAEGRGFILILGSNAVIFEDEFAAASNPIDGIVSQSQIGLYKTTSVSCWKASVDQQTEAPAPTDRPAVA